MLFIFHSIRLILCGRVKLNPGPKNTKYLSICHWNLNSLAAHSFAKVTALKAFNVKEILILFVCWSQT